MAIFTMSTFQGNHLTQLVDTYVLYTLSLKKNENRHARSKSEVAQVRAEIRGHQAPITNIQYNPIFGNPLRKRNKEHSKMTSIETGDVFLTSSYDWSLKLWHAKYNEPLAVFRKHDDYIYDCQWSTRHPCVFACVDGTGQLSIYHLVTNFEDPMLTLKSFPNRSEKAGPLTRLKWSNDGQQLLVGDNFGQFWMFQCHQSLYQCEDEDFDVFEWIIQKRIKFQTQRAT
ncbi:dynein intermediate chain, cytosolic [Reticulomyxa filosa]|uniref:Dynein intermediate chain, cytosolic n=1 Tax=Reticulomyxa filosa TaxID=46433 RepID=X6PBS0_RETFI|nr:dynein intermediate chain, cytosolic [Reticulomyxa filosa]|eukprot:ETO35122.1 dynein intermediate chain, cytosolic [Reticulomyxa filosa]